MRDRIQIGLLALTFVFMLPPSIVKMCERADAKDGPCPGVDGCTFESATTGAVYISRAPHGGTWVQGVDCKWTPLLDDLGIAPNVYVVRIPCRGIE